MVGDGGHHREQRVDGDIGKWTAEPGHLKKGFGPDRLSERDRLGMWRGKALTRSRRCGTTPFHRMGGGRGEGRWRAAFEPENKNKFKNENERRDPEDRPM